MIKSAAPRAALGLKVLSIKRFLPYRFNQNLLQFGSALILGLAAATVLPQPQTQAAQRIYFTYGPIGRSIPISDLRALADTGKTTRQLQWYFRIANVDSEAVRQVLTHQVNLDLLLTDRIANTIPGEYVLYQAGKLVHTKSRQGAVQIRALRSAFVLSAADDNKISLLEFLEKYPTPEVYVDGVVLARVARNVSGFINQIEPTIAVIQEFLANLICNCDASNSSNPTGSPTANPTGSPSNSNRP
jgi:hypothetical protein